MSTPTRLIRRFGDFLDRLRRDQRGAIAVQFAFLAIPLSVLIFAMVDLGRVSLQRRQMQDALDAATLIAARSTAITDPDLDKVGDAAFVAEIAGLGLGIDGSNATFKAGKDNTVVGTASGLIKPIIANLWTNKDITITATSEVVRSVKKLEVALVLDNTGSMASKLGSVSKIEALKTAAKSLVTTLAAAAARASDTDAVKISVVPFSMTVNVGSTYQTANWMTGTQPSAYGTDLFNTSQNRFTLLNNLGLSWKGCVESRPAPYDIQDTAPSTGVPATMFVPYFAPDEPDDSTVTYQWGYYSYYYRDSRVKNGGEILNNWITNDKSSVNSWSTRQGEPSKYAANNKNNVISQAKTGTDYGPNSGCGLTSLMRLTNVGTAAGATAVNSKLDDMIADGNTNVAMGLMWGWHTISPSAPFADGAAYNAPKVQKIIVLLTDGDNVNSESSNPNNSDYSGYGYIGQGRLRNSSNVALGASSSGSDRRDAMDSRQTKACANAKAAGVQVYSIGVGVSNRAKAILQACATSSDMYFDVNDATELTGVFNTIAGAIQNLRISK